MAATVKKYVTHQEVAIISVLNQLVVQRPT